MKTFTRYAAIEFLKMFALTLAGMTLFMFLVVGAREAVRYGLGPGPMLKIMPYVLPESMRFSIPSAALLAACTVYGRMAGDNEVVAVKSLGISPLALIVPALITSFVVSSMAVCVSDLAVSWGLPGRQQMLFESVEQIVYGVLRTPPRSYSNDQFAITVKDVVGRQLIWPSITIYGKAGEPPIRISAREATLKRNAEQNVLQIELIDMFYEGKHGIEAGWTGSIPPIPIPLSSGDDDDSQRSPSDYALRDLSEQAEKQYLHIEQLEKTLAARAAFALVSGDIEGLSRAEWQAERRGLSAARYRLNRLEIEPWRRWSNGFSCFFFVLVGVPLSIRRRNSDFISNFFFAFAPILLVYYPLMTFGVDRAKDGALPFHAVWLGNLAMGLWGVFLLRRVLKY